MSSRLVKFALYNGIKRCINMRNVLAVKQDGVKVTVQYNVDTEHITFNSKEEAEKLYEQLTSEGSSEVIRKL